MSEYSVNLIGASGLVGKTFLKILSEEHFPVKNINMFASAESAGKTIRFNGKKYYLQTLSNRLPGADFTLFATDNGISKEYIPYALKTSRYVIDNSSEFRLNKDTPLIIPEINFSDIQNSRLISNPNCTTAICALPLWLLHNEFRLKRVRFCSYQSVSGSGKKGLLALKGVKNNAYKYDIRKTCIPQIGDFSDDGYTTEELKMRDEIRKIFVLPKLPVSATCVRVPTEFCHGITVSAVFEKDFSIEEVKNIISQSDEIELSDDIAQNTYPTSEIATGKNKVYVGRIRKDYAENNAVLFYALSDNLRRGAAYNAYKIIKSFIAKR